MARDTSKSKKPVYDVDPCPYNPMQLDTAKTQRLTYEEHQKLIQEKKCFYCKKMGHLFANCKERPKSKGKGKGKGKGRMKRHHLGPRACTANATSDPKEGSDEEEEEEEEEEEKDKAKDVPPAYMKKNLMTAIKKLSVDKREDLLDSMALKSDQDF